MCKVLKKQLFLYLHGRIINYFYASHMVTWIGSFKDDAFSVL